jgi:hypothetical protein
LLAAGLSEQGYSQALQIMAMENLLREREQQRLGVVAGDFRHSDQYFIAFFGRPGFEDTWGWRFLGHHLSLSYTIVGQRYLAVTPCGMGAQPACAGVLRPLAAEEDQAFALLGSLSAQQRDEAVIHTVAPADRQPVVLLGRRYQARDAALLPDTGQSPADRVRQRDRRGEPYPLRVARLP